jgi:hypothetical protein
LFDEACRSDATRGERGVMIGILGVGGYTGGNENKEESTVVNNHYDIRFEKADNAPDDYNYLFKLGSSDNTDKVGVRVDTLCILALEAIRDKCTWNGGEARNQYGTFKYQSNSPGYPSKCGLPVSHGP